MSKQSTVTGTPQRKAEPKARVAALTALPEQTVLSQPDQNAQNNTRYGAPWSPTRKLAPIELPILQSRVRGILSKSPPQKAGTTPTQAASSAPLNVLGVSAAQSPLAVQGKTVSDITVTFTRNPSDSAFDHANIFVIGYQGNKNAVEYATVSDSPANFVLESTGETIKVYVQACNASGIVSAVIKSCPSAVTTLSGVVTAPPAPTLVQLQLATPTGYQFTFDQVVLPPTTEDVIANYNVYRYTSNSSGSATVIRTIKHDSTASGAQIVVQDRVNRGDIYYYWVTTVNTIGLESVKEAAFVGTPMTYQPAVSTGQLVASQVVVSNSVASGSSTAAFVSSNTVFMPGLFTVDIVTYVPTAGYIFYVLLWDSNTGGNPNGYLFRFHNGSGQFPGVIYKVTNGTWVQIGTNNGSPWSATQPIGNYHFFGEWNPDGKMYLYVNGFLRWSVTDTTFTPTGATYYGGSGSPSIAPFQDNWAQTGSAPLLGQGSISSAGLGTFTYTATGTSINWSWTSFNIYNPDGSTYTVGSGSQNFTGLTGGTTYYFGFYVSTATGVLTGVLSDVSSGKAKFSAAYITQTLNGDGNIAINYNVTAVPTAGGSGGGGGTYCFTPETRLFNEREIASVKAGERVWIDCGLSYQERIVESVTESDYDGLVHNCGAGWCLPNHRFKQNGEWKRADEIYPETKHYSGKVHNLHIKTDDDSERNFVLLNGAVAHNQKIV